MYTPDKARITFLGVWNFDLYIRRLEKISFRVDKFVTALPVALFHKDCNSFSQRLVRCRDHLKLIVCADDVLEKTITVSLAREGLYLSMEGRGN